MGVGVGGSGKGGFKFQYLGQLLHQGAVLQSEVVLLAVQLPL